jgi:hypothetical protein
VEHASGRRHQGGGIRGRHQGGSIKGGGIREDASGRRHQGGGTIGEATKRKHGGGIMDEASWRRHQGGEIMEEAYWMHPGDIWEKSGRGIWEASRRMHPGCIHLGNIWESSEKHLGGIWEASTLGFPPLSRLLSTNQAAFKTTNSLSFYRSLLTCDDCGTPFLYHWAHF